MSYGVALTLLAGIALSVIPFSTPALADPPRPPAVQDDASRDDASRQRDIKRAQATADEQKRQAERQRSVKALEASALAREIDRQAERVRQESLALAARADRRPARADKAKVSPPGSSVPISLQACNDATPQEALAPAGSVLLIGKGWISKNRGLAEALTHGTSVELSIGGVAIPNAERFFVAPAPLDHPILGRVWITRWAYPLTITTQTPIAVNVRWTLERRLADSVLNEDGSPLRFPQDFSVTLACTIVPAVSVTGRITGAGLGLSDGRVAAHDATTSVTRAGADTDASGEFAMLLRPGNYRFFFFTLSGPWIPEWWDDQASFTSATTVTLTVGAAAPRLLADLERGVFLSGRVTDAETHQAVSGVTVGAQRADVVCCEFFGATSDADGRYQMAVRKSVTLRVGFHPQSAGVPYVEQWWNAKPTFDVADLLVVGTADVANIDAALERGVFVRGRVTDAADGQPLANASVTAQAVNVACCQQFFASTNAQGEYAMPVPQHVTLVVGFFPPAGPLPYLPSYWNARQSFAEADQLSVGAVDISGINGALERGVFMRGRVTDAETGAGIGGVAVVAFVPPCCQNFFAVTALDGTYAMAVRMNVTLKVEFFAGALLSSIPYLNQWYRGRTNFTDADPITVTAAEVTGIDAALERGVFLRGHVTDAVTGSAIAGANITVFPVGVPCCDNTFASTDAAGDYAVVVRKNGTVKVIFDKPFGSTIPYIPEWYNDKSTFDSADPIAVGSSDVLGINGALERGVTLRGRVTDALSGDGLGSVSVNAQRVDVPCCETFFASTDADGNYSISLRRGTSLKVGFFPAANDPIAHLSEWWDDRPAFAEADVVLVGADDLSGIDAALERGVFVRGRVTDAQTGDGLASAGVNAQRVDVPCCETFFVSTDSEGNYSMTVRRGVSVKVGFFPPFQDPVPHLREWWQDRGSFQDADVLLIGESDFSDIDAALERGVFVRGHVTEAETGHDLPQVNVNAFVPDGPCCENFFGFTDAAGRYAMAVRTNVNLKVSFFPPFGSDLLQEYYNDKPDFGSANVVPVGVTDIDGINAALERGVRLSGRVSDSAGAGIPDVSVNIETEICCSFVAGTGTAPDGTYSLAVRPGRYKVAFYPQTSSGFLFEYYADKPHSGVADVVVVGATPVIGIDATLERGVLISGRVTDAASALGVQGISVSVQTAVCCGGTGTQTGADGAYSVAVRPGSYKVGFFPPPTSDLLLEFYNDKRDFNAATVLVAETAPLSGIDAALERGVRVSGRVRDPNGLGAPNVSVNLSDPTSGLWIAGTGTRSDGTYSLTVRPGSYKVDFSPQPSSGLLYEYYNNKATFTDADVLTVVIGTPLVNIDATLERGILISGRVTDAASALGVQGVAVSVQTAVCCAGVAGTQSGADGTYSVAVRPGSYKVSFFPPSTSDLLFEFYNNMRDFNAATVLVAETAPLSGIDAALERGVRVSGRVRDPDGLGVPNVSVNLESPTDCNWLTGTMTLSDGTYSLTVQPGSYKVSFAPLPSSDLVSERYNNKTRCADADVLTAVIGTPLASIDATLERGVRLSGRVTNAGGAGIQGVSVGVQTAVCCEGVTGMLTAADGGYSVMVRPGSYKVGFFPSAGSGYLFEFYNNTRDFSAATVVVVGASPVTGIDAVLETELPVTPLTIVDARMASNVGTTNFTELGDAFILRFSAAMDPNFTADAIQVQDQDGTAVTFRCGVVPNRVSCQWDTVGTTLTVTVDLSVLAHEEDNVGTTPGLQIPFNVSSLTGFMDIHGNLPNILASEDRLVDFE